MTKKGIFAIIPVYFKLAEGERDMSPELFITLALVFLLAVVLIVKFINKKSAENQAKERSNSSAEQGSNTDYEDYTDTLNIGDKWLEDNNLEEDTYGFILNSYCLLKDKVPVKIVNVNLNDKTISISLSFPRTNITKIIPVKVKTIDFTIDETIPLGSVLADVTVSDDAEYDSPEYDSEIETPLDRVDWDQVIDFLSFDLSLSQETYDKIFPSLV